MVVDQLVKLVLGIFFGSFVSEDLALIGAGSLSANGSIGLPAAIIAAYLGIFVGDLLVFASGRLLGRRVLKIAPFRWLVSESSLDKGAEWLKKSGMNAVFLSRLTPGLRFPVYFSAGVFNTDSLKFASYFAIAAAVWTPIVVVGAHFVGSNAADSTNHGQPQWVGTIAAAVFAFLLLNLIIRLVTWRGRRALVSRWIRITNWEFWPIQLFYLPVVIYILLLSLKHRSITVFADANPAITAGGFVGESKNEIYHLLKTAAKDHLPAHQLIPGDLSTRKRIETAMEFIHQNQLSFPIAVKPDKGERGYGVEMVHTREMLERKLENADDDQILQEFAGGVEFSVFYYRFPYDKAGTIFSMTEKQFPTVEGDGVSTLEELILKDRRAVALANAYFKRNADRLLTVPPRGAEITIVDIGTHSQGAIFRDGSWALSPLLERRIDELCQKLDGFHFGRFDLRSPSPEHFMRGIFKVIELNGVTSESTNIYDPKCSLTEAYRILFKQWWIAFEIGRQNRERGVKATRITDLIRLLLKRWFNVRRSSVGAFDDPVGVIRSV